MENVITFLKILFLGKAVLLTPAPVDISNRWITLEPNKPLLTITGGASLEVRLSKKNQIFRGANDFNELYKVANKAFPKSTIEAKLLDQSETEIILSNRIVSISKDYVSLGLVGNHPLPTDKEYISLKIRSATTIRNAQIAWRNYKH